MDRRDFIRTSTVAAASFAAAPILAQEPGERLPISIDTRQVTGPLRHVWSECAGSDRAAITLRESWRQDLDRWRNEVGLKRVRFHGILNDELGVYAPSIMKLNKAIPNFHNVFEVYDGLIARGVSPFVEVGFMPKALASGDRTFGFYNANISPPKSNEAWGEFIGMFVKALISRYGIAAIREWPFEIWNEADLTFFWSGSQQQYFDMYKAAAVAIKSIDPKLQVGGPATSGGKWIGEFASYCAQNNAPLDFFSTHAYSGGNQEHMYPKGTKFSVNQAIPDTIDKVHGIIQSSAFASKPLWVTEWSSDSPAMIAHVLSHCMAKVRGMSHWVLSGTYEELGVPDYMLKEGDNGWATLFRGIARPSFNTYKLLHALGDQQLSAQGPAIASRRANGKVSTLVWNLAEAQQAAGIPGATATRTVVGSPKRLEVRFDGQKPGTAARVSFVDQVRGSAMPAWRKMGSPQYPTQAQIAELRRASEIPPAATMRLDRNSTITLDLPPEGVALIELA